MKRTPRAPLTPEQQAQVASVYRLALHQANKYYRRFNGSIPLEDLQDAAIDGIMYAASVYQDDRGAKFSTLAFLAIKSKICHFFQLRKGIRRTRERAVGSLDVTYTDGSPVFDPNDYRERPPDDEVSAAELFDRARKVLPERLFTVLSLHLVEGCTADEIGERIGRTKGRVQQILYKALTRLSRDPALTAVVGKTPPQETAQPSPGLGLTKAAHILGTTTTTLRKMIEPDEANADHDSRQLVAKSDLERLKNALADMAEEKRKAQEAKRAEAEKAKETRRAEVERARLDKEQHRAQEAKRLEIERAGAERRRETRRVREARVAGDVVDLTGVGNALGTDYSHAMTLTYTKKIASFKIGREVFVHREELDRFLRECWSPERAAEHNERCGRLRASRRENATMNARPADLVEA